MAYKDSDQIANDSNYALGDYSFRIERSSGTSPGYDKIEAICTKGGKNARKSIQVPSSTQMLGWYVEANETEASVYVVLQDQEIPIGDFDSVVTSAWTYVYLYAGSPLTDNLSTPGAVHVAYFQNSSSGTMVYAAFGSFSVSNDVVWAGNHYHHTYGTSKATYHDQEFYYGTHVYTGSDLSTQQSISLPVNSYPSGYSAYNAAVKMLFGSDEGDGTTKLVGRFAIDLGDAGGEGPGSDWIDPGDYDPDWEEGDPTHTLYVEVTGALSGRHNDPIEDPSYSYIPADKDTVKDYGCGGDGGHGGGGGAGASTVVVHKFATNQANSKEVTALARRHGYGSGGGKGGKGGNGCILVYY